jgi:hypothetical protein
VKKPLFVVLLVGIAMVAGSRWASAQDAVLAHVPFPFLVGDRLLPAGDYRVTHPTDSAEHVLQIVSRDGRSEAFATYDDTGIDTGRTAALQFKTVGGDRLLWRVSVPGEDVYQLPLDAGLKAEAKLARAAAEKGKKGNDQ